MMNRRRFLVGLGALVTLPLAAEAQQAGTIPRIVVFGTLPESSASHLAAEFRQGLRDLGYVEGQNIGIEWRPGVADRIVTDLVRLKVDLIVATNSELATAAKAATSTIPVVMVSGDPLADGLVSSLTRPGGKVTGLSTLASDIVGKQSELLKQMVPRLSRIAILWNPSNPFHAAQIREAEEAARALGAQPHLFSALNSRDLERAFTEMLKAQADGLLVLADGPVFLNHRARIADLAAQKRLPAIHPRREHVEAGGLISYGTDRRAVFRRLAVYVDKILKGSGPADLPVEQPTKFELVINLKAAKALGLTIPPSLLLRADQVIE